MKNYFKKFKNIERQEEPEEKTRLIEQILRIKTIFDYLHEGQDPKTLLAQAQNRPLSSLEEELVSQLPLFDENEEKEVADKIDVIAQKHNLTRNIDQNAMDIIKKEDPELGKNMIAIGLFNEQRLRQAQFYDKIKPFFDRANKRYFFPAGYKKLSGFDTEMGKVAIIEEYQYAINPYRSVLYHLLRHSVNLTGDETGFETERLIRKTFENKKVLELGSGPGFFLHLLKGFGADVYGLDTEEQFKEKAQKAGLDLRIGKAQDLDQIFPGQEFDIIYSKDFLSFAVTKQDAGPIMEAAYHHLKTGGLSVHSIEYIRKSEEDYFKMIERKSQGQFDIDKMKEHFQKLDEQTREMMLHTNLLNISPDHLEEIGYKLLTAPRWDVDRFLSLSMTK